MSRYRLSKQSRSDLDDIWLYIASDNVTAASGWGLIILALLTTIAGTLILARRRVAVGA